MDVKKYLKEQIQKEDDEILARNEEFLETLKDQVVEKPKRVKSHRHLRAWVASVASLAAAVIVAVCVWVFYPSQPIIYYDTENFVRVKSTLEDMNSDMKEFHFQIDETRYYMYIYKVFDSVSGDVLFYDMDLGDSFTEIHIVAVCNENFHWKALESSHVTRAKLPSYEIEYFGGKQTNSEFGIDYLDYNARIQKGSEIVYITRYKEYVLDSDEGSFLSEIQKIIQ